MIWTIWRKRKLNISVSAQLSNFPSRYGSSGSRDSPSTVLVCARMHKPPREVNPMDNMYLALAGRVEPAAAWRPVEISSIPRRQGETFPSARGRYCCKAADNTENKMINPPRRVIVSKPFMIEVSSSFPMEGRGGISFLFAPESE